MKNHFETNEPISPIDSMDRHNIPPGGNTGTGDFQAGENGSQPSVPKLLLDHPVLTAGEMQEKHPDPPAPVIDGAIGVGEKLVLGGSSKAGKTFAMLGLASAVASGREWMGFRCKKGAVLFLNFEISPARMAERNRRLDHRGLGMDGVDFLNLRGGAFGWTTLTEALEHLAEERSYSLIILDPIYKMLGDAEENNNTAIASMLAEVERIAVKTGAATAFAHHFSKGNKSQVDAMDRLSGAGAFGRDPDAIITLTAHEEENCFAIESEVRNFARPEARTVEFAFPLFELRDDLDPEKLKQKPGGRKAKGGPANIVEALEENGGGLMGAGEIDRVVMGATKASDRTVRKWRASALEDGLITETGGLYGLP